MLYHFPSKETLLAAVLERRDELDEALIDNHQDGVQQLLELLAVVARNTTRRAIVELYTMLSAEATAQDHAAHEFFVTRYRRILRDIPGIRAQLATDRTCRLP